MIFFADEVAELSLKLFQDIIVQTYNINKNFDYCISLWLFILFFIYRKITVLFRKLNDDGHLKQVKPQTALTYIVANNETRP